jgi:hypothetical protein
MRSSWLREPIRYFLLYAGAGLVVIPCSIAFVLLKSHGFAGIVLALPLIVGVVGGFVITEWFDVPGKTTESLPVPQPMMPNTHFVPFPAWGSAFAAGAVCFSLIQMGHVTLSQKQPPNEWRPSGFLFESHAEIESPTKFIPIREI